MVRKSPGAFRTISEVAEVLDIPAHVLRFWESRFTQIKPVKRGGGRRYYRPQDIDLLRGIRDLLYRDGLTIKGAQKVLREQGVKHVAELGHLAPEADPIQTPQAAEAAPEPTPKPTPVAAPPVAPPPKPKPEPDHRAFPQVDLPAAAVPAPQETQFDLFADTKHQSRRPFPPDPARAQRADSLRHLYGKLEALREKMATRRA